MPQLALDIIDDRHSQKLNRGASEHPEMKAVNKVIQIEDVEDKAHSSERRDKVPSLRESKVSLNKLKETESFGNTLPIMARLSGSDLT